MVSLQNEGFRHRWSLVVLDVPDLDAARERLGFDFEEGDFLGAPGILVTVAGTGLFLTQVQ